MISRSAILLTLLSALMLGAFSGQTRAQSKYLVETNTDLGVAYEVHPKLNQVPNQIGRDTSHLVQKFRPAEERDYISGKLGSYEWYFDVLRFNKTGRGGGSGKNRGPKTGGDGEKEKTPEEKAAEEAIEEFRSRNEANSFEQWVKEKDPLAEDRQWNKVNQFKKGKKNIPDAYFWEYYDTRIMSLGGRRVDLIWYVCACVYDLGDAELALVVRMPIPKSGKKLPSKYKKIAYRIISSLKRVELKDAMANDEDRDQYADTPGKKKMLNKLKDNLKDIRNRWDYQTLPHYIVTWSWEDPQDNEEYVSAKNFAVRLAGELEGMRNRFTQFYPPHEKMEDNYSIIRVCSNYDEFTSYGNTPRGVVGWFNPGTKELVVFNDVDKIFGANSFDTTLGVMFHELWHQYSDQWWPEVELHRWFDEGLAEFFGSQRNKGSEKRPKWKFEYLKGRYGSLQRQIAQSTLIPTEDIIYWSRAKFYGPRAPDHYAQGWAMVDFLMRGEKRSKKWEDPFAQIIETYGKVCLEGKDSKKAVDMAFDGVDLDAYEAAWLDWVESGQIKR